MKKLMLILAALAVSTSVVLTGCGKDQTEEKKPAEENAQEQTAEENAEGENSEDANAEKSETVALEGTVAEFNAYLVDTLAKYIDAKDIDKEAVANIGEFDISVAAERYAVMMGESYKKYYGLSEEEVDELIQNIYTENASLIYFAHKNGVSLTEEEIKATADATISNLEADYGDTLDEVLATSPYTKHYYALYALYSSLYNKLSEKMLTDAESDFIKEARTEALDFYSQEENILLRAKHILVKFPENEDGSEVTEEQKAETLKKANEVLAEVNAMTDISEFDALIEKYNEDPGMQSNPHGYYFSKGQMVASFETTTLELEEGKTSDPVESPYGYHIILKLPIDDEHFVETDAFKSFASDKLMESILAETKDMEIEYTDASPVSPAHS